jgi:hypothetical protein
VTDRVRTEEVKAALAPIEKLRIELESVQGGPDGHDVT